MFDIATELQMPFVLGLIILSALLMASNRVRYDTIALGVVLALMLSGILSVQESLSGFSNSVVILIAGLLVVGEMLDRTGVARLVGDWILVKGGATEPRLLMLIMLCAAVLGAFMSSTAVVAIFIPILLRIAKTTGISGSKLLMPMSYAALISGMLTLIATPANIVVSGDLKNHGYEPLGFFSFTAMGVIVLTGSILYMVYVGRHWLKNHNNNTPVNDSRSLLEVWQDFRCEREIKSLRISQHSALANVSIRDAKLGTLYQCRILGIGRPSHNETEQIVAPPPDFILRSGDILILVGNPNKIAQAIGEQNLTEHIPSARDQKRWAWEMGAISLLVHPNSKLIGQSIKEKQFRTVHGLDVVGLRRSHQSQSEFEDVKLESGDSLFVVGPWKKLSQLKQQNHDFILLEMPKDIDEVVPAHNRLPVSLMILAAMIGISLFDVMPLVAAVLIAAMAAVGTRCLSAEEAYRSIHWSNIVLVAGMLPLADALEKTGGSEMIVSNLTALLGHAGPEAMFSFLFFLTAIMTLVLSNTTSAVLVGPIAIAAAESMGVSPYPFAIAVLFAASSGFISPVASPVVTLVVEPGGYRFMDFMKLGLPILLLVYATVLLLTPLLFPY